MKVLNLYAGIGGNRKLWGNCEVTAVENNPDVAEIYKSFFPQDKVVVGDAHEYLRLHFREFDFIWSSPPCPTHSVLQMTRYYDESLKYPEMSLCQEIIWLQTFFKGNWIVENVKPYYKTLIQPSFELEKHFFWSNKILWNLDFNLGTYTAIRDDIKSMQKLYGFNLEQYKRKTDIRKCLRNCVIPEVGKYIFDKINNFEEKAQ